MRIRSIAAALAAFVLLGLPASAQDGEKPITWVAYDKVERGKLDDAVKLIVEDGAPVLDKLMADGTVASWGVATPINHWADFEWNVVTWVTLPGWSQVDTWVGGVMAQMQARSEADAKAMAEQEAAMYPSRSHFDEVLNNEVFSPAAEDAPPPRYIMTGTHKAKEGQAQAGIKAWEPWWRIIDKLKADGKVLSYGMHTQALHTDPSFTIRDWYTLPDLASVAAFAAASEEEWTAEQQTAFEAAYERQPHRDTILLIVHFGGQPAQ